MALYYDEHLGLWKRGKVIGVDDERAHYCIIKWGGSVESVCYKALYKDNANGQIPKLIYSEEDTNEAFNNRFGTMMKSLHWSYFADVFSIELLAKQWQKIDSNFDGFIDESEVDCILHKLVPIFLDKYTIVGGVLPTETIQQMVKKLITKHLDTNGDGKISFKEFTNCSLAIPQEFVMSCIFFLSPQLLKAQKKKKNTIGKM